MLFRSLSVFLGVSQNTVMTAYTQLLEEGYISSIEKKGYFVCKIEDLDQFEIKKVEVISLIHEDKNTIEYNFSINSVDHESFPFSILRKLFREVIDEEDKGLLHISNVQGIDELRESITTYLHNARGVNCSKNEIIISSGTEFLVQSIILLLDKNTVYGLENPGFEKPRLVLNAHACITLPIQIDREGMSLSDTNINKADVLFISPSHQFPTGGIMPIRSEERRVGKQCRYRWWADH